MQSAWPATSPGLPLLERLGWYREMLTARRASVPTLEPQRHLMPR
jgi:hypothetical protein